MMNKKTIKEFLKLDMGKILLYVILWYSLFEPLGFFVGDIFYDLGYHPEDPSTYFFEKIAGICAFAFLFLCYFLSCFIVNIFDRFQSREQRIKFFKLTKKKIFWVIILFILSEFLLCLFNNWLSVDTSIERFIFAIYLGPYYLGSYLCNIININYSDYCGMGYGGMSCFLCGITLFFATLYILSSLIVCVYNKIKTKKLILVIAIIVGILTIGAVGFAAWQHFEEISELKEKESKFAYLSKEKEAIPEIKKDEEFKEDKTEDWKTYQNKNYGYKIKYSEDSKLTEKKDSVRIDFPFSSGTNLSEKYLEITVKENSPEKCSNPLSTMIIKTETVYLNGIKFKKETGSGAAAGSWYDSVSYSTIKENQCFRLNFMLHSFNPGALYPDMPKEYDKNKESEIFNQMISTFKFIESTETADWETYRNEEYGFEVKYPENWESWKNLPGKFPAETFFSRQTPEEEATIEIEEVILTEKASIQLVEEMIDKRISKMGVIIQPKKKIKIGGHEGYEVIGTLCTRYCTGSSKDIYSSFSIVYFFDNDKICKVSYVEGVNGVGWKESMEDWKYYSDFNQILSTFKFLAIDETTNWKTYKKGIFTLKYPSEIWNLKDERLFHKEIGDSCAITPGGLWRQSLIKIVESIDTNFNGYEARQVILGSNKDEVSIINVYFDANLPGKEFSLYLPKDKQDKQTCENDFKEVISTIEFEK